MVRMIILCAALSINVQSMSSEIEKICNPIVDKNSYNKSVQNYGSLLHLLFHSSQAFVQRDLSKFDPPTGDGMCQFGTLSMLQKENQSVDQQMLQEELRLFETLNDPLNYEQIKKDALSRKQKPKTSEILRLNLPDQVGLDFSNVDDELLARYIVTVEARNRETLINLPKSKKNILRKIINQSNIAMAHAIAEYAQHPIDTYLCQNAVDSGSFSSVSTYAGFSAIIGYLQKTAIPVVAKIRIFCDDPSCCQHKHNFVQHELNVVYQSEENGKNLQLLQQDQIDSLERTQGCYVTEIISDKTEDQKGKQLCLQISQNLTNVFDVDDALNNDIVKIENKECTIFLQASEQLKKIPLETMLLVEAADHPQYHDKTKAIDFAKIEEIFGPEVTLQYKKNITEQKEFANTNGFCRKNMSSAYTYHDYADTIENALQ